MWTAVVATCANSSQVRVVRKELRILQRKGWIGKEAILLTVEDPAEGMGSGSATINALLVTAEHLSAKAGYQVVTADVLKDARVLMFHCGRGCAFAPCGKTFVTLPVEITSDSNRPSTLMTNVVLLLDFVTKLAIDAPHGVWVCSTDMLLHGAQQPPCLATDNWSKRPDVIMFVTMETPQYATHHGLVVIGPDDDDVSDIVYCGTLERIGKIRLREGKVPIVAGLVYLSVAVTESLLLLHNVDPLNSCTYLGLDSGAVPLQASLFFDILVAMAADVSEKSFLSGKCGKLYNQMRGFERDQRKAMNVARKRIWDGLRRFKMKAGILDGVSHLYWSEVNSLKDHIKTLQSISSSASKTLHSHIEHSPLSGRELILNSKIQRTEFSGESIVQHCLLIGLETRPNRVGSDTFLLGLEVDSSEQKCPFSVGNGMALIRCFVSMNSSDVGCILIIMGINDDPNATFDSPRSTFCNLPWNDFLSRTGISSQDLWPDREILTQSLMTAKLYPIQMRDSSSWIDSLWMQPPFNINPLAIENWRKEHRLSLQDVVSRLSLSDNMNLIRRSFARVTADKVKATLEDAAELSLLPYFYCSTIEGWQDFLLDMLDQVAASFDHGNLNPGKAGRSLACLADLLACIAGKDGGLRSGPTANKSWGPAFSLLENAGVVGSISAGVAALSEERSRWQGEPTRLIRAARHYEGAAQILIRQAVMSSKTFVNLTNAPLTAIGEWVIAECPARVDLQGGWTDTPPICYELGGSVVNVAVLIDGKKPIGAKVRRIDQLELVLTLGSDEDTSMHLVIKHLQDLEDYCQPTAPGALLKAAVLCTEIVDHRSNLSLHQQLQTKYGGGFEIQTWSNLPQGSGLGTSSILAGAVIATLWSASGKTYDRASVIHAVLYLEQMLTTGGGWQDQVGGIMGGANRAFSPPGFPVEVKVQPIVLAAGVEQLLNQHLVLIYTGKVRLAKNLLQNVIRSWYARDSFIVSCFKELVASSIECTRALQEGNLMEVGLCLNRYWQQKQFIAPGCAPAMVVEMMAALEPHVYGQTLAGAGGGGFICLLARQPDSGSTFAKILGQIQGMEKSKIYITSLDMNGMSIRCGNQEIEIS